ncbi:MAG: diguanylate cyclase, partial [Myxococcota bacterium]
ALAVAERLRSNVEGAELGDGQDACRITVSIGVATLAAGSTADDLLRAAYTATYAAKGAGKNCVKVADD